MSTTKVFAQRITWPIFAAAACLAFIGCEYDVPITATPTRKIEEKFLGD